MYVSMLANHTRHAAVSDLPFPLLILALTARRRSTLFTSVLVIGVMTAAGCSGAGLQGLLTVQPSERSEAPKAVVEDPTFEEQVLAGSRKWEAEVSIDWSKVFIVSDWSTIREPQEKQIVSQNRIVEIVGVVTEDDDYDGVTFRRGDCYVFRTNAYQEHLGGGEYRDNVEVVFEDEWGGFDTNRLTMIDCAKVSLSEPATADPAPPDDQ